MPLIGENMLKEMSKTRRRSERLKVFSTNSLSDATENLPQAHQSTASVPSTTVPCTEDEDSGKDQPAKRRRKQHRKQLKRVCKVSSELTRILPRKTRNGKRKASEPDPQSNAVDVENADLPHLPENERRVLTEQPLTPFTNDDDDDDNDDDDDDDSLPRFDFVPDEKFEEGDLIWAKHGRDPHWPAVALKLVKRRDRLRKVRVRFIEFDENDKLRHKPLSMNYSSRRIQPISKDYDAHKNTEMPDDVSRRFTKAIERVEKFLFSCSQPNLKAIDYFSATEEGEGDRENAMTESGGGDGDRGGGDCLGMDAFHLSWMSNNGSGDADVHGKGIKSEVEQEEEEEEDEDRKETIEINDDDDVSYVDKRPTFSDDTYRRITERQRQEQELVDLIKNSEKVKIVDVDFENQAHLRNVLLEETKSTYHSTFHKPGKTRAENRALKILGFGPIENELHIAELTKFLQRLLCTIKRRPKQVDDIYYLTDVWFPEATIFGIHLQRDVSLDKAEEIFARGVDYTPEEMAVFTEDMIANTTDEDRAEQKARTKRILANNGLDVLLSNGML